MIKEGQEDNLDNVKRYERRVPLTSILLSPPPKKKHHIKGSYKAHVVKFEMRELCFAILMARIHDDVVRNSHYFYFNSMKKHLHDTFGPFGFSKERNLVELLPP